MPTTGREIIYLTPNLHTGHIVEASYALLDISLQITKRMEILLEGLAMIDPDYISAEITQAVLKPTSLPDKIQKVWEHQEWWVSSFLLTARVIRDPKDLDLRLGKLLPTLDPQDPDTAERFLFGSRERMDFLLSNRGRTTLDTLNYGTHAFIESRVLRRALNEGVFLTQVDPT